MPVWPEALGRFGDTTAANCFLGDAMNLVIGTSLVTCLNNALPFCSTFSTSTRFSGSVTFTSTVTSTNGGLLGVGAVTTTYVLVNSPSPLSTSFTTFVGTAGFTSTITSIDPGNILIAGITTTYALVGVPITLSTVTSTAGTNPPTTSTVTQNGSTFVRVVVPTPLSTSRITSGTAAFTSTAVATILSTTTSTDFLGGRHTSTLTSLTTYVLVGVPTIALPYTTVTNLGPATTFTQFTATVAGQTGTVVVQAPAIFTTVTNVGAATTFTQFTPTVAGQVGTVVVQVPAIYSTVTRVGTAGAVSTTFTQFTATVAGQTGTVVVQVPPLYTTVTSVATAGSIATTFTQLTATVVGQTGTVVVQVPPLQTVTTTTFGISAVGYTSTVTTVIGSTTSLVAVVGVPVQPFEIFVTDALAQPLGYLDVVGPGTGGTFNTTLSDFPNGALFYFSTDTGQLALAPASGVAATPLYSVEGLAGGVLPLQFALNNPTTNTPVSAALWPEGTIRISVGQNIGVAVYICNGVLFVGPGTPAAGCVQAFLSPTRSPATYVTTTITSGSTSHVYTSAATGTTVSNNGTVTSTVPTPTATCTAVGFTYTGYANPFPYPYGTDGNNPYYLGFNSSYFANSSLTPLFSGVWNGDTNFALNAGTSTLYNTTSVNNQQLAIVYRGYFVVPTTGNWTLNMPTSDDVSYFWIGADATGNGWGETNFNMRATFRIPARDPVSFNFIAGRLYPMVILSANGEGPSGLTITITGPTGTLYSNTASFFYQPSCASLSYLSASIQPSVTGCAATGIEYINRPNPTFITTTTTSVTTPFLQLPRTVTSTITTTRTFNPNQYTSPAASPYSVINFDGVVRDLTLPSTNTTGTVYGRGPYNLDQVVMWIRGYFLPNVTGLHTFTLNQPDDTGYLWIGTKAINTWNATNADIINADFYGASLSTSLSLTAGTPIPIRMAFANHGGNYGYSLQVKDPNNLIKTNTFGMFLQPFCGTVPWSQWT